MRTLAAILCTLLLSGFSAPRSGATVHYSNGSAASVQALHNAALNGDTITVPAGTFTWSTPVTLSKSITLQGEGSGITVIRDAVQSAPLMTWNLVANKASRMTGIEFRNGGRTAQSFTGIVIVSGIAYDNRTMRIDHCKFDRLNGLALKFLDVIGVADHNVFLEPGHEAIQVWHGKWGGRRFGDGSWTDANHFGTSRFLFIEDNTFYGGPHAIDAYAGARYVARYNTFAYSKHGGHGTESSGRHRGMRAIESYNNRFIGNGNGGVLIDIRSGVALVHGNTVTGGSPGLTKRFKLACHRMFHAFGFWGGADGRSRWDVNQIGGPFYSGVASGGGTLTVTVAVAANWMVRYAIVKTSNLGANNFSAITANTSNTITFLGAGGYGANMRFASGDTFSLYKVNHVLDQPGRSGGSLITGNPPVLPPGWNNQITDPCYEWNNIDTSTGQNVPIHFSDPHSICRVNEHYFNSRQAPGYTPYIYPHPLTVLPVGAARANVTDFNGDGSPDYVLQRASTQQTAIWYLDNNVYLGSASGPTLSGAWGLAAVADFNRDSHPDYALFNPVTDGTGIWYLSGPTYIGSAFGPTPSGWEVAAAADLNSDGKPDYLLYNGNSRQTGIYYLDNNVYAGSAYGPTLPPGWALVAAADFNGDSKPDYLLYNVNTQQTAMYYLNNNVYAGSAYGPTLPPGWILVAAADFNGDSKPDYLLYNVNTQQTGIYYLDNNVYTGSAWGPTLSPGWSFFGP